MKKIAGPDIPTRPSINQVDGADRPHESGRARGAETFTQFEASERKNYSFVHPTGPAADNCINWLDLGMSLPRMWNFLLVTVGR